MIAAISFIVTLGILVFVHELGHLLAARWMGVGVKRFSLGFGPRLWSRVDKSGTSWQVALVPLGGFVEMEGEFGQTLPPKKEAAPNAAERLSLGGRAIIALAGPLANLLFAVIATWAFLTVQGQPVSSRLEVAGFGGILSGSAADDAGLQVGDIPLSIDGDSITSFSELAMAIASSQRQEPGQEIEILIERRVDGFQAEQLTVRLSPRKGAGGRWLIGVMPSPPVYEPMGIFESLPKAVMFVVSTSGRIFQVLGDIVAERSADQLGGPIMIAKVAAAAAVTGVWGFIQFLSLLSINLAVFNLLPIPALDGGYLALFGFARIFGGRIANRVARIALPIGVVFLMMLMLFVVAQDLLRG